MSPDHNICANCIHWHGCANGVGRCHRFPPSIAYVPEVYANGVRYNADWPLTHKDDWCGEFKCKDSPLSHRDQPDPAEPAISAAE